MKINHNRIISALFAVLAVCVTARADTFGTSGNEFTIDFVNIGNAGNPADTTGDPNPAGAVSYAYRMGKYEISQNTIDRATASGLLNVTAGGWSGSQPAANINWYEAAAFVNWLNTSTGKTAAYDLAWNGSAWSMNLWSSGQAWQLGGQNLFRNKDAYYFLPNDGEWYKAAYYNPSGSNYFDYPTGSDTAPTAVASGTAAGTAVYNGATTAPASVNDAGGLSPYGTMGQVGNIWEWNESAYMQPNDSPTENREGRGGFWSDGANFVRSDYRGFNGPSFENNSIGFRVASADVIPEPSTYALVLLGIGAVYVWKRRTRLHRESATS